MHDCAPMASLSFFRSPAGVFNRDPLEINGVIECQYVSHLGQS